MSLSVAGDSSRSMAKRLAKNFIVVSGETSVSTNFSLCIAMLTQADITVEGKKTENLQSKEKSYLKHPHRQYLPHVWLDVRLDDATVQGHLTELLLGLQVGQSSDVACHGRVETRPEKHNTTFFIIPGSEIFLDRRSSTYLSSFSVRPPLLFIRPRACTVSACRIWSASATAPPLFPPPFDFFTLGIFAL
ncbi:hypothetical protein INR49_029561 [Caranx melampygus]|nr:hypothetical protein INR49_029561 [Caranx melampygus]